MRDKWVNQTTTVTLCASSKNDEKRFNNNVAVTVELLSISSSVKQNQ